jgi:AcrR family transcriptional regulator
MASTTKDRILDVACDLFSEQGYDGTSLREIAERLGITKAALYYHFTSKTEILRALLEPAIRLQAELIERLDAASDLEGWADALAWITDAMLGNYRLFLLFDRNRAAVESLAEHSAFFEDHQRLHDRVEAAVTASGLPLAQRVRMVCALGAVAAFDDFAGRMIAGEDPERLRAELNAVVREILGLDATRPTANVTD